MRKLLSLNCWFIQTGLLLLGCLFISNDSMAQNEIKTEEIEVVKDFDARLVDAKKLKIRAKLPPIDSSVRNFKYDISVENVQIEYLPPTLRPIAMQPDKLTDPFNHHLTVGYGTPKALLGDLGIRILQTDLYEINLNAEHYSAENKDLEDQKVSKTKGALSGRYYVSDNLAVGANVGYTQNDMWLYGYDHSASTGPDLRNQNRRFKTIEFGANIQNPVRSGADFDYRAGIDFIRYEDNLNLQEDGVLISASGTKWISGQFPLTIDAGAVLTTFQQVENSTKETLQNFHVGPSFTYNKNALHFKLGAEVASSMDEIYFFPDLLISYKLAGNTIIPFLGWNGGLQQQIFRSITSYNPYALFNPDQMRNAREQQYFGGVKGMYQSLQYEGKVGFRQVKNLATYQSNIVDERRFDVLFDDGNIFTISASLQAEVIKNLEAGGTVSKNFFDLDNQEKAWHLPTFEMKLFAQYKAVKDKLKLKASITAGDGVPYRMLDDSVQKLGGLFDVSFHADYQLFKNAGLFIHANNLTSNNRERWLQYPSFGSSFIGGVSVRF